MRFLLPNNKIMNLIPNKNQVENKSLLHIIQEQSVEISELKNIIGSLSKENLELKEKNYFLQEKLSNCEKNISLLEKQIALYNTKKDSSNSSIPPSQDPYRIKRTESLRKISGRKPGGQLGHEGYTLETVSEPTEIIKHQPDYCQRCGGDLTGISAELIGKRQVIDIPPVIPIVSEHQIYSKRCLCGHCTEAKYPVEVHSSVCYGPRIQGLTAYLHTRQYIPYERMKELYEDIFGLKISSGSLVNIIEAFADKSLDIYKEMRRRVFNSSVVGADETGININGKNRWAWVFQTPQITYIHADISRGKKVIDELFPQGFNKSILVHDCWTSYFGVKTKGHQICTAHLLRELKYLGKLYKDQQWTDDFTKLLQNALDLKKSLSKDEYSKNNQKCYLIEEKVTQMLEKNINSQHKKLVVFKERIQKYRNYLLQFLYHPKVPADNNASERAIRNLKVKQKISGLFKSEKGANAFVIIRSVIDTIIKSNNRIWEAIELIPKIC